MNKVHINLSVNSEVLEAHRKLGTNISKFCNDVLEASLVADGKAILERAEGQMRLSTTIVKTAQAKAAIEEQTTEMLKEVAALRTPDEKVISKSLVLQQNELKANEILKKASRLSGISVGGLIARLQRL